MHVFHPARSNVIGCAFFVKIEKIDPDGEVVAVFRYARNEEKTIEQ